MGRLVGVPVGSEVEVRLGKGELAVVEPAFNTVRTIRARSASWFAGGLAALLMNIAPTITTSIKPNKIAGVNSQRDAGCSFFLVGLDFGTLISTGDAAVGDCAFSHASPAKAR